MADRETVMTWLEICGKNDDCSGGCPYDGGETVDCVSKLMADALALLKEQEVAYQGAEELLRQKTTLFDDAIKRLKEQDERIKMLEHQLETITKWRANAGAFD